jgi:hypothetical protein
LLLAASHGVVTELFMRRGVHMPGGITTAYTLIFCVLAYIWYYQDSKLTGYARGSVLSAAIILLPVVGLPVYAAITRAEKGRIKSGLMVLGFFVLLLLISVITGVALQVATDAA